MSGRGGEKEKARGRDGWLQRQGYGTKRKGGRGAGEAVKKTDTRNLEKEAHHVVEHERQRGVRYLNKKRREHVREYERGLERRRYFSASSDFDTVNAQK